MGMKIEQKLGLRVRSLRIRRGMTQENLAERINRSVDMVSKMETGASAPSFESLKRLSGALEVSMHDLFDFEGDGEDPKRIILLTKVTDIARKLSTKDLTHATEILVTFENNRLF